MDIDKIRQIVNASVEDAVKEALIIRVLALDKKVIPDILNILNEEREQKQELISDMNVEISRYNIFINSPKLLKKELTFVNNETKKLYEKWKGFIAPLFNNKFS